MEDGNGIVLSLGLSCGGSAGKSKAKDASSDNKTDGGGGNKLMGGNVNVADVSLKHLFHTVFEKHKSIGPQRSESSTQRQESFCWTDLGRSSGQDARLSSDMQGNNSQFARFQELQGANNRSTEVNGERSSIEIGGKVWTEASNKRKMSFEDAINKKKHEGESEHVFGKKESEQVNAHSKSHMGINLLKNSHVSVTTKDGSSAENEDVAESEAEGSTSRLVSQHDDGSKRYKGGVSDIPKDKRSIADAHVIDTQGQKMSNAAGKQPGLELGSLTIKQAQGPKPISSQCYISRGIDLGQY